MKSIHSFAAVALAAAVLAGCSHDNDPSYVKGNTDVSIAFSNPFIDNSVKERAGTPTTKETLEGFKVWGFVQSPASVIFDGALVTRNSNNSWNISETEYWYLGQPYWFTAVSTGEIENPEYYTFTPTSTPSVTEEYAGGGSLLFSNSRAQGEEDLIYAFSGKVQHDAETTINPVPLTFNHLLSQVTFEFTNQMTSRTTLEIDNMSLNGSAAEATIDLSNGAETATWASPEGTFAINDFDFNNDGIEFGSSAQSTPAYIIPFGTTNAYSISFEVKVLNSGAQMATYTHTITLPETNFIKGHSYKFKASLTPDNINPAGQLKPIEFTVDDVNQWQQEPNVPIRSNQGI